MKKIIIIIIPILIGIGVFLSSYIIMNKKETKTSNNKLEYKIIFERYIQFDNKIISNYNEYKKTIKEINEDSLKINTNSYNDNFFKNKSIVLINITKSSGPLDINKVELSTKDNTLYVDVSVKHYEVGTMALEGKLLLIEVDKNITKYKVNRKYV